MPTSYYKMNRPNLHPIAPHSKFEIWNALLDILIIRVYFVHCILRSITTFITFMLNFGFSVVQTTYVFRNFCRITNDCPVKTFLTLFMLTAVWTVFSIISRPLVSFDVFAVCFDWNPVWFRMPGTRFFVLRVEDIFSLIFFAAVCIARQICTSKINPFSVFSELTMFSIQKPNDL